eukprot:gene17998-21436_t
MNFRVSLISRGGTYSAYERVSRHQNYLAIEAWASNSYTATANYYVFEDVLKQPFRADNNGEVVWASTGVSIPVQPQTAELFEKTVAIRERPTDHNLLGSTGEVGIFVILPQELRLDESLIVDFWRGLKQPRSLQLFPVDGTLSCEERLLEGNSCEDLERRFYCPSECPTTLWRGSEACCFHGKFHPPQCIPENVTYADIQADVNWKSPNCREFLHPDAGWDVGYFESVIVTLGLNFSVNYVGYDGLNSILRNRSHLGVPTIFYWWKPEPLILRYNASRVQLPEFSTNFDTEFSSSLDPLTSDIGFDQEVIHLTKIISQDVKTLEPDLFHLWERLFLDAEDLEALMRLHPLSGSHSTAQTVDEAACEWTKANVNRWKPWVRNSARASDYNVETPGASGAESFNTLEIVFLVLVPFCVPIIGMLIYAHLKETDDTILDRSLLANLSHSTDNSVLSSKNFCTWFEHQYNETPVIVQRVMLVSERWTERLPWAAKHSKTMAFTPDKFLRPHLLAILPRQCTGAAPDAEKASRSGLSDDQHESSLSGVRALVKRDLAIMCEKVQHPNVIETMGIVKDATGWLLVHNRSVGTTLFDVMNNSTMTFDAFCLLSITKNILAGMKYLHRKHPSIVYVCISSKNITIDGNLTAK